jgi:uncharacterized membrane protein HdeD (DUF308 family)
LIVGKATYVFSSAQANLLAKTRSGNGLNVPTTTRGIVILGVFVLVFGLYNFFLPDSAWRRTHRRSTATGPTASGRRYVRIGGILGLVIGAVLLIGAAAGMT